MGSGQWPTHFQSEKILDKNRIIDKTNRIEFLFEKFSKNMIIPNILTIYIFSVRL